MAEVVDNLRPKKKVKFRKGKNLLTAYLLCFVGGICGLHHFYLNRDRHGFVFICTLGGYAGCGIIYDLFNMPRYVREANEDVITHIRFLNAAGRRPPFSALRFTCQIFVGFLFGKIVNIAIPPQLRRLHFLPPLFIALGVWNVGNIGREKGELKPCWLAACLTYFAVYFFGIDEDLTMLLISISSATVFFFQCRYWRNEEQPRLGILERALKLLPAIGVLLALLCSYLYYNAVLEDENGNKKSFFYAWNTVLNHDWLDSKTQLLRNYLSSMDNFKKGLDELKDWLFELVCQNLIFF